MKSQNPITEEEIEDLKETLFYVGYRVAENGKESFDFRAIAIYALTHVNTSAIGQSKE